MAEEIAPKIGEEVSSNTCPIFLMFDHQDPDEKAKQDRADNITQLQLALFTVPSFALSLWICLPLKYHSECNHYDRQLEIRRAVGLVRERQLWFSPTRMLFRL